MGLNSAFWRNKKVFVTGHTGFKGAWLCLWLESLGADVTGYSLKPPTKPSFYELARVQKGMRSITGDVRDAALLKKSLKSFKPEIVFHLAAQSLVTESYRDPVGTYETNVLGTANVLEALREVKSVRSIVVVTSDKCYENIGKPKYYKEGDPLGGYDPYSSSKACQEIVAAAYRNSFSLPIATARAGNVIGGGDWAANRLVPDIVRSLLANKSIPIRHPEAVRPWQHVLDPLYGYLLLAEHLYRERGVFRSGWNFGPSSKDPKPVSWIADQLVSQWPRAASWKRIGNFQHEAHDLRLDSSKARLKLGWKSNLDIKTALEWIVEWTLCYKNGGDLRQFSEQQIKQYVKKL